MHFISRFPLTFFFFLDIHTFRYVRLVVMIRIESDMLQKIFRISENVKRDV